MLNYTGLTNEKAAEILKEHGRNSLKGKARPGPLKIFVGHFRDGQ